MANPQSLNDALEENKKLRMIVGFFVFTAETRKMQGLEILEQQLKMRKSEALVLAKECERDYLLLS